MNCKINWDDGVFAVPDKVAEGLKLSSGKALKLMIYYLRYRKFPDDPSVIGTDSDDIEDAVNYWRQVGVFSEDKPVNFGVNGSGRAVSCGEKEGDRLSFAGENFSDKQICGGGENIAGNALSTAEQPTADGDSGNNGINGKPSVQAADEFESRRQPDALQEQAAAEGKSAGGKNANITAPSRKSLLPGEIAERIEKSGEVAFMFRTAEAELKRVLTFDDQRTLLWLHDHLGMSADVVVMIAAYCCRRWGASMKKIEDTAISMYERDIVTHESVNRELAAMERRCGYEEKVKNKLGIQTALTPRQREYTEEWCGKGISVELVAKAYYITMETKGKADFRYMGGILKKWYDAGVTTPEAADGFDDRGSGNNAPKPAAAQRSAPKKDRSNGNAEPSYNLAAILAED